MQSLENVKKMFEMRLEGKTLEEIGQHFGITRERVRQIIGNNIKVPGRNISQCVFPGIVRYLREYGLSMKKLHEETGCVCSQVFYRKMWGVKQFTLPEIKAILAFTGMTFEEAFGEEIKPDRKEG